VEPGLAVELKPHSVLIQQQSHQTGIVRAGGFVAQIRPVQLVRCCCAFTASITPRITSLAWNSGQLRIGTWLHGTQHLGTVNTGRSNGVPHISTKQAGDLVTGLPPHQEQLEIVLRLKEQRSL
jgi:hypothetical protein